MRQRFKGVTSVPLRQNCPCHKNHPLALSRDIQRSVYLASKKKKKLYRTTNYLNSS